MQVEQGVWEAVLYQETADCVDQSISSFARIFDKYKTS
jgi:hypothetical protein